jgi:hypothetical protein
VTPAPSGAYSAPANEPAAEIPTRKTPVAERALSRLDAAREAIVEIIDSIESADLPSFSEKDGCLWFEELSMGWISATNPATLADREVYRLFCAEAAGRELARRKRQSGGAS